MAFLAMLLFTLEATFIKMIGPDINSAQVALMRCVVQFAFLAIWLRGSFRLAFRSDRPRMHIIRGTLSAVGAVADDYVFANLPLATATVIFFGNVIFMTMAAGPVLGEKVGWRRWTATLVGFAGILIVVRPTTVTFDSPMLVAILLAVNSTGITLATKGLTRTEPTATIMGYIGLTTICVNLPWSLATWNWPTGWVWGLTIIIGITGNVRPVGVNLVVPGRRRLGHRAGPVSPDRASGDHRGVALRRDAGCPDGGRRDPRHRLRSLHHAAGGGVARQRRAVRRHRACRAGISPGCAECRRDLLDVAVTKMRADGQADQALAGALRDREAARPRTEIRESRMEMQRRGVGQRRRNAALEQRRPDRVAVVDMDNVVAPGVERPGAGLRTIHRQPGQRRLVGGGLLPPRGQARVDIGELDAQHSGLDFVHALVQALRLMEQWLHGRPALHVAEGTGRRRRSSACARPARRRR